MSDLQPNNTIKQDDPRNEILKGPAPVIRKAYPKFRWWDPVHLKFYYSTNALFGDVNDVEKHEFIAPHVIIIDAHEKKVIAEDMQWLSEFTGVLDSTPEMNPIFSGDIVRISNANNDGKELNQVVQWAVPYARWSISPYLMGRREIFIMGNIYENPPPPPEPTPHFETDTNMSAFKKKNGKLVN